MDFINLFKLLNENEVFSSNETNDITTSIHCVMEQYITTNILDIIYPNFDKDLTIYIYNQFIDQLLVLYAEDMEYIIKFKLFNIVKSVKYNIYLSLIPIRSYNYSFIRNIPLNIDHLTNKIINLEGMYQPIQRTPEWYLFRHNLLTASSIWKVFGTQSSKNQLICEKCAPYTKYRQPFLDSPLHWGQKYEPVSVMFYESLYDTTIKEFGCIKHSKYPYIGASPDGVNNNPLNPRYGRMLEIKNIVSRVINGIPKSEYWIQMQIQMETCDLNECDFLETKFIEYENEEEFYADGSITFGIDNKLKGIMILFSNMGNYHYEYAPLFISKEDFDLWEEQVLEKNSNMVWIQNIFWKLDKYSNILVLRNKLWFNSALPIITEFWNIICQEKIMGFEHRKPKKKRSINSVNNIFNNKKCLISKDETKTIIINKLSNE